MPFHGEVDRERDALRAGRTLIGTLLSVKWHFDEERRRKLVVIYEFNSPLNGKCIRGTSELRIPATQTMPAPGSAIVVMYLDDERHTVW
jgi:hypothetical protein